MIGGVCFYGDSMDDYFVDTYSVRILASNVLPTEREFSSERTRNYKSYCACNVGDIVLVRNNEGITYTAEVMPTVLDQDCCKGFIFGICDISAIESARARVARRKQLMDFMLQTDAELKALHALKQMANSNPEIADAFNEWSAFGIDRHMEVI